METQSVDHLTAEIRDLFYRNIRVLGLNDAASIKAFKMHFVGLTIQALECDWLNGSGLYKTHTYVHPDIARELMGVGEEEVTSALAQGFVRNEKLIRMLKTFNQHGLDMDRMLAVDGLQQNNSFEQKNYIGNLRYGDTKTIFGNGEEFKRLHVQTVRKMYDMLKNEPVPPKQVYEIVRRCIEEMARVKLPEVELEDDEAMDEKLQDKCGKFYMKTMGKENIEKLAKSLKKIRGEKRTNEREDEPAANEKKVKER